LNEQLKYSNRANRKAVPTEPVQTWIQLPRGNKAILPSRFQHEDVRAADSLIEYWVNQFTEKGQIVFDPFAGYGTTLLVAEEMERVGYGIEYSKPKADYVHGLLVHPERLIHGDSRKLDEFQLPPIDLCLTSPSIHKPKRRRKPICRLPAKRIRLPILSTGDGQYFLSRGPQDESKGSSRNRSLQFEESR